MTTSARVYVTTYSIYNQGLQFASAQHSFWLDVSDLDFDALTENFNEVDPSCKDDHEFMFTDYEGFPASLYSESGMDFDAILKYDNLEDDEKHLVELLLDHGCVCDISDAINNVEDCYIFEGSLSDYAYEYCEQCGFEMDSFLSNYIDYDRMGRELVWYSNIIELSYNRYLIANNLTKTTRP